MRPSTPARVSPVLDKYINKFYTDATGQKFVVKMERDDISKIGDFLNERGTNIWFGFFDFDKSEYKNMVESAAQGMFISPALLKLHNDKLSSDISVIIPVRDGTVDKALVSELLMHELMHAYIQWKDIKTGRVSSPFNIMRRIRDAMRNMAHPHKYTYSQLLQKNDYVDPSRYFKNKIQLFSRVLAYACQSGEINANLASVDAFLYENGGNTKKLAKCRTIEFMARVRKYFNFICENATDADWKWIYKNATYIYKTDTESIQHFKKRYITYYTKVLNDFDAKVKKISEKYIIKNTENEFARGASKLRMSDAKRRVYKLPENAVKCR